MDSFRMIQHFFTRMSCHMCMNHFKPEDIELIREDEGVHVVSVYCHHCERQIGVAMVGVELHGDMAEHRHFPDPELTESELERLSAFAPISEDDVLNAHHFFNNLGADWASQLPVLSEEDTEVGGNATRDDGIDLPADSSS